MLPLLTQLNPWLGVFVPNLDQSRDAQHLWYNDLPEQTPLDASYLRHIRRWLEAGEKLQSEDTKKANELIKSCIETLTQTQQHVIAQIQAKFASSYHRQKGPQMLSKRKGPPVGIEIKSWPKKLWDPKISWIITNN